jgi:chemotaxis protein CheX
MNVELENDLLADVLGRSKSKADTQALETTDSSMSREEFFADCLYRSAKSVLTTMCGLEVGAAGSPAIDAGAARHELSGIVSMSGTVKAIIIINLPPALALKASAALLGSVSKEIDGDVIDAIAELANMIGGNTKNLLKIEGAQLSMPTVVKGPNHELLMDSRVKQWGMELEVEGKHLRLEYIICNE